MLVMVLVLVPEIPPSSHLKVNDYHREDNMVKYNHIMGAYVK